MSALIGMPPRPSVVQRIVAPDSLAQYEAVAAELGVDILPSRRESKILDFMATANIPHYATRDVERYMDSLARTVGKPWCWKGLRQTDHAFHRTLVDGHELVALDGRWWIRWLQVASCISFFGPMSWLSFTLPRTADSQRWTDGSPLAHWQTWAGWIVASALMLAYKQLSGRSIVDGETCGHTESGPYQHPVPLAHLTHALAIKAAFPELEFFVSDYASVKPDPFIMCTHHDGWRIVFGVWDEPGFGA